MSAGFLGLPLFIWAIMFGLMTIIWIVVWPNKRQAPLGSWRYIVLRWFHPLVWLLLAVAAIVAGLDTTSRGSIAQPIALLSLIVYLIFMATLVTSKPAR